MVGIRERDSELAEEDSEVVGPEDEGEHALPKGEVKIANGEEPADKPKSARQSVILNLNSILV